MLPIRKNCCCGEKKTGSRENLRAIMDADSVGREVTYPRNNSLVPSRTCDSTSSRCPNEVAWGGQAEAFYRSMGRSMGRDIPSGSYNFVILGTGAGSRKRSRYRRLAGHLDKAKQA